MWRGVRRGFALIVVLTIVSVISCASTALPSVKPYEPQRGDVAGLRVTPVSPQQGGGWRVSWAYSQRGAVYRVSVDGQPVGTTRESSYRIPAGPGVRLDRPSPIVSVGTVDSANTVWGVGWLPRPSTALACSPVTFVGVRGSGQNSDAEGWAEGMGDRARNILDATRRHLEVDSAQIAGVGVAYPAHRADTVDGALTYRQSTQAGLKALRDALWAWSVECPTTRFVLFGYSQGADIVATVWAGLDDSIRQRVERVILFGDPHYNPRDPSSRSPLATDDGPLGAREEIRDERVFSWCAELDVVCQGTLGNLVNLRQRVHGLQYDEWQELSALELATHLSNQKLVATSR